MIGLQDMHCHLDLYPNFKEQVKLRELQKIRTLTVTTTPKAWPKNKELTQGLSFVRAALGLHPELVSKGHNDINLWETYLSEADYIGEVGLDGRREHNKTLPLQIEIFSHILSQCNLFRKKILSIHSPGAVKIVLDLLENNITSSETHIILHWFTGTKSEARRAATNGYYFSINKRMMTSKKWSDLSSVIPIEKILIETDAPFIEKKYIGHENKLITDVKEGLINSYHCAGSDIGEVLNHNFLKLFHSNAANS